MDGHVDEAVGETVSGIPMRQECHDWLLSEMRPSGQPCVRDTLGRVGHIVVGLLWLTYRHRQSGAVSGAMDPRQEKLEAIVANWGHNVA